MLGGANYTSLLPPHSFINAAEFISPQGATLWHHSDQDISIPPCLRPGRPPLRAAPGRWSVHEIFWLEETLQRLQVKGSIKSWSSNLVVKFHECSWSLSSVWRGPIRVLEVSSSVRPHVRLVHVGLSMYIYQVRSWSEHCILILTLLPQLQKSVFCNLPNVRSWGVCKQGKKGGQKMSLHFLFTLYFPSSFL